MAFEYQYMGQKVVLEQDEDVVAVRYKEPAIHSVRAAVAAGAGIGPFGNRYEVPREKFTILPVASAPQPRPQRHAAAMKALKDSKDVVRVAPVFKVGDRRILATDRVLVGFKEQTANPEDTLKKLYCTVLEKRDREYLVQLPEDACPFEVTNKLMGLKEVEYAEPDFVTIGKHIAQYVPRPDGPHISPQATGDPLLGQQYAVKITKALEAWNLQVGDPSIKIAMLDEGVDTNHEDLKAAVTGAYDGTDDDTFQEPNAWDGHGTACAGLAGAIPNNDRGVRGIGAGCSLMAVRIAYSPQPNANWVTTNSWIARSIDWAWQHGADVLSNSWGGGAPSTAILNAFERARTQGRGGNGCVIVIAAGNESGPVSFPGTLPQVVTVSASNEKDEFKTKISSDGEWWWGSNFGPEVDVAAPGVHNVTTDMSGAAGYDPSNYITTFNGTSSATPIVAGAVGLVLSANKSLKESAVRSIIAQAADKVGSLPYMNGRNDQFGNGRLNVLKAVQIAQNQGGQVSLQGTVVQFGAGLTKAGAFFLQMANGDTFLLRRHTGNETAAGPILEAQSLSYLAQFAGPNRTVTYLQRQDTPQGSILWGVTVS